MSVKTNVEEMLVEKGIITRAQLERVKKVQFDHRDPFSVVVLGNFRRFLLVIFLFLFLHLDFSFIYSKFSMPFWGFFY